MNITKEQPDNLNAVISIKIEEADYLPKVEEVLKDYRKKARIDGFRPGNVPMGMIRKMYYKPILAEEINHLVGDKLMAYIRDEDLQILGEPLPHLDGQKEVDFDNDKEFEFSFDIGLRPDFELEINKEDKIPHYKIKVEDQIIDEQVENTRQRFGSLLSVETAQEDDTVQVRLVQTDDQGAPLEDGVMVEDAKMSLKMMKDEDQKKLFIGCKSGDKIHFKIKQAYPNPTDLGSLLKIDAADVEALTEDFEAEILDVTTFDKHELNQDLFDQVYGEGIVNSVEEFRAKVSEELEAAYQRESNYRFALDVKDYYLNKAELPLPVEFLKRWIIESNDQLSPESLDEEFSEYEEEFRWQIIKDKFIRTSEISVSEEELVEFASMMTRNQFYQYGLYNLTDEQIEQFARENLKKPEEARKLHQNKMEDKLIQHIKETINPEAKDISTDEFKKLFEK